MSVRNSRRAVENDSTHQISKEMHPAQEPRHRTCAKDATGGRGHHDAWTADDEPRPSFRDESTRMRGPGKVTFGCVGQKASRPVAERGPVSPNRSLSPGDGGAPDPSGGASHPI